MMLSGLGEGVKRADAYPNCPLHPQTLGDDARKLARKLPELRGGANPEH